MSRSSNKRKRNNKNDQHQQSSLLSPKDIVDANTVDVGNENKKVKVKAKKPKKEKKDRNDEPDVAPPSGTSSSLSSKSAVATFVVDYNKNKSKTKDDSSTTVPPISAHAKLADLIYPLSVSTFLDDYFQPLQQQRASPTAATPKQTAVHFTCPTGQEARHAQRIKNLIDNEMLKLDPKRLLEETSSESIFIWLRPPATATNHHLPPQLQQQQEQLPLVQSMEVADASHALALLQCGHATYCRAPPHVEQPLVASLLRDTGLGCGQYDPTGNGTRCLGRGEVEVFITSSSSSNNHNTASSSSSSSSSLHTTDWHFDFQENFTIQLSGTKQWTLQSGTIPFPLRGCTPHYASPSSVEGQLQAAHLVDRKFQFGHPQANVNAVGEPQTILVRPGDVLYFPAGMWHKVECIEPGVSINVSLMATTYAHVIGQAVQHLLLERDEWRRTVACHPARPHGVLDHVQQLLQDLPKLLQSYTEINNLPQCILPPILQCPTKFASTGNDDHEEEGEDDDHDEDGDQKAVDVDDLCESYQDRDLVVSVSDFQFPEDWKKNLDDKVNSILIKNPLARLTRMDEIKKFYDQRQHQPQQQNNGKQDDASLLFVLHVNYAGNEMLESAVRVVFRDNAKSKCLNQLYELLEIKPSHSPSSVSPPQLVLNDPELIANQGGMIDCMLYHGYLQWATPTKLTQP
jgi:hypothetical protein